MNRLFLGLMVLAFASGCGLHTLHGKIMRGVDLEARERIHVLRHAKDKRQLDQIIAERLELAGFEATSGSETDAMPGGLDAVVRYEDHWQWDMVNYLIVLRIDFRDPATWELLASGQSYRSSTKRQSPSEMINEVIAAILSER